MRLKPFFTYYGGKYRIAPLTTNSHVDVLIADLEKMDDGGGDDMSRSDLQNIQTIAAQAKVIEKLKDAVFWFEVNSYDKRDAEKAGQFWREIRAIESAALTKQPEPKEGV